MSPEQREVTRRLRILEHARESDDEKIGADTRGEVWFMNNADEGLYFRSRVFWLGSENRRGDTGLVPL